MSSWHFELNCWLIVTNRYCPNHLKKTICKGPPTPSDKQTWKITKSIDKFQGVKEIELWIHISQIPQREGTLLVINLKINGSSNYWLQSPVKAFLETFYCWSSMGMSPNLLLVLCIHIIKNVTTFWCLIFILLVPLYKIGLKQSNSSQNRIYPPSL